MLTKEQNERLTRVGPGTPMGELMRRHWQPIAAQAQLAEKPVLPIRVLGEDFVLFKDKEGRLGLIEPRCAHRRVHMKHGYVVDEGLRCPYHAWTYDVDGQCTATPAEPANSTLKDRVKLRNYPVQELAGMIFAYIGPDPVPLLPRWKPLVMPNVMRQISWTPIDCNWLQATENSPDYTHTEWLHGHYAMHVLNGRGYGPDEPLVRNTAPFLEHIVEFDNEPFELGLLRRVLLEGQTKESEMWSVGQPIIMPNMHSVSGGGIVGFTWRTAVDDTHTIQWSNRGFHPGEGVTVPPQETVPGFEIPRFNENGEWNDHVLGTQDHMVFENQEPILDRTKEKLGSTDRGIVLYREMLMEQMDIVEQGGEPMNVFRDPVANECIEFPITFEPNQLTTTTKDGKFSAGGVTHLFGNNYSPALKDFEKLAEQAAKVKEDATSE